MLTKIIKRHILEHAQEEYPRECFGVIVEGKYYACRNIAPFGEGEAQLHPDDYREFEGRIEAFVHSHPDGSSKASQADLVQMEYFNVPYIICGYPSSDFGVYVPTGYKAPLIGRKFFHGILDCFTLVRDFYERELGIVIPDFERRDRWWEDSSSQSLYMDNFEQAGFIQIPVEDLRYGDSLIAKVGDTEHPNHAMVYLGSQGNLKSEQNTEVQGNSIILHHLYGRKSNREVFGDMWLAKTVVAVRHKDLL